MALQQVVFLISVQGEPTSIETLAQTMLSIANAKLLINKKPSRQGDIKYSYADIAQAKSIWGYNPKISLKDGLYNLLKEKLVVNNI